MKMLEIYNNLLFYFKIHNHEGLDPSSITNSTKFLTLTYSKYYLIARLKTSFYSRLFNFLGHRVLFIFEPIENLSFTKGICLYLMAKLNMDDFNTDDFNLLNELDKKRIQGTSLFAHDVEYCIRSKTITKSTPNVVTTYFVADLYFQLYMKYKNSEYQIYFKDVVENLVATIPYFEKSATEICFQYTTVSKYHVHNANLFFAELLVKYIYMYKNNENTTKYKKLIIRSLNYSLNDFKKTSTYFYAGEETRNTQIDNYHTGYVLRSMEQIKKYGSDYINIQNLDVEIGKLLSFYLNNFIINGKYIYKYKLKTVEAHSLAESILIFSIFRDRIPEKTLHDYLNKIYKSINLLYHGGKFINKATTFLGIPIIKDKLDYIRWSQAWMFYSIACFVTQGMNRDIE